MSDCPPHHYVMPAPDGTGVNKGRCIKCGAVRDWPSYLDNELGYSSTSGAQARGAAATHARRKLYKNAEGRAGQPTRPYK